MELLKPYRVLDLTGPLGFLAGKILGDLGADVIKLEPPGGDPSRQMPPHLKTADGKSDSIYWSAFNSNKRGVTLNLHTQTGRDLFLRLVERADFILESFSPGTIEEWGLGYDKLSRQKPELILVSITPFGRDGPYRNYLGSDLEIMALSGAMSLAGEADGEPMRITEPQAPMWVSAEAALGALTALAYRRLTGKGQHVDVSAQAAVLSALAHAPTFWDMNRINPERAGLYITGRCISGARMRAFWPCRDGWINFIIYGGSAGLHTNRALVAWMDERAAAPAWLQQIDWTRFEVTHLTQEEVDKLEAPIGQFFSTLTKQEFFEEAITRQMLGYPVTTVEDIYKDPQLAARQFWQVVKNPTSNLNYPGGFAVINGERLRIHRPAPRVGQHNQEIYIEGMGLEPSAILELQEAGVI